MNRKSDASPRQRPKRAWRLPAFLKLPLRYPVRSGVSAVILGASTMIVVNALELQTTKHPSPLFGSFAEAPTVKAAPVGMPRPDASETRPVTTGSSPQSKRDINSLLGLKREEGATVPLPRPKPPAVAGQAGSSGVTVR